MKPEVTVTQRAALIASCLLVALFFLAPWPLLTKLRAVSFGIDPQRPAHSHFLGGVQLPLEARKMGIYGGFVLSVAYIGWLGRGRSSRLPPAPLLLLLAGFVGAMAVDGTNAFFYDLGLPHLYAPDNRLRLATGLLTGFAVGTLIWPIFNLTFWGDRPGFPAVANGRELLFGLVPCAVLFAVEVSGFGPALVPLAVLGGVGVILLVTVLNMVVVLIVTRREGQARSGWDAAVPALAGLLLAAAELAGLAAVRYALFGTAQLP